MTPPIGYVLKRFPRLSETFVLNEILELERQGQPVHVFALRPSDDGRSHAEVRRVRGRVTLVPGGSFPRTRGALRSHLRLARSRPRQYAAGWRRVLRSRSVHAAEQLQQAVVVADTAGRLGIRHLHAHFASLPAGVALDAHRLTGIGYSLTAHAKDIYASVTAAELAPKLESARFVVTVSDFNARHIESIAPSAEVMRVYNGLDLDRFPTRDGSAPDQPPLVLAVGRLVEKKGFADLVDACRLMRDDGCRFRCVIVGGGLLEGQLRDRIARHGLDGTVVLAGPLTRDEVLPLYRRATVLVAPCVVGADGNRDGLPTVLTEAMAIGVPVVATPVTGIPELVRHGETGLLAPEHDPGRLATAIETVLVDPDAARRRAAAARALVEREFDLRINVAALRRRFAETEEMSPA